MSESDAPTEPLREDGDPSAPVRRATPDPDPGLAPDPEHEVRETPPEGSGPG